VNQRRAGEMLERAVALAPSDARVLFQYGSFLQAPNPARARIRARARRPPCGSGA